MRATALATDRLGAEVDQQAAKPRPVKMTRAKNLATLNARAAADQIEAHAADVTVRGHLGVREYVDLVPHATLRWPCMISSSSAFETAPWLRSMPRSWRSRPGPPA